MSSENPYRPPVEPTGGGYASYAPSLPATIVPFQSLRGLGTATKSLLAAVAVAKLAAIAATLYLIRSLGDGVDFSADAVQFSAGILGVTVLVAVLLTLVTGIVYLMWVHKAYQNLPALGVSKLEATPGWAVGHYFIPILNLFRPYQTIVEILRGSAPREQFLRNQVPTAIAGWWWAGWIAAAILGQISGVVVRGNRVDAPTLKIGAWIDVAMHVVSLLTALLAIAVVHRITTNQEAKSHDPTLFGTVNGPVGQFFQPVATSPFAPDPFAPASNPFAEPKGLGSASDLRDDGRGLHRT